MTLTMRNWWNMIRYRYAERLDVRARRYQELTKEEQEKVYHYWTTGKVA